MLKLGAHPCQEIELARSILFPEEVLENMYVTGCKHQKLSAAQRTEVIPTSYVEQWSEDAKTEWNTVCLVLDHLEKQYKVWVFPLQARMEVLPCFMFQIWHSSTYSITGSRDRSINLSLLE